MNFTETIRKKRNGLALNREEIQNWIRGYVNEEIPDYQVSALLMALFFQGMNREEIFHLTEAMIDSGERITLAKGEKSIIDKHSTGGVGDKTSLVLSPLYVAGGLQVAKLSGPGLGHSGGTVDKLQAIPGFQTELDTSSFEKQLTQIDIALSSQSKNIVPADKLIYALRDVTATVECIPLVASSIMSKKLAIDSDVIVLDVKVGSGSFNEDPEMATLLSNTMIDIGKHFNRKVVTVLSNMEVPLGKAVGNSLEVIEAIETLKGKGPKDFEELCLELAGHGFQQAGVSVSAEAGKEFAKSLIDSGKAYAHFCEWVKSQGGDLNAIENTDKLPLASFRLTFKSSVDGYVSGIAARLIGEISMELGAGRVKKGGDIDLGAGVYLHKQLGDKLQTGDTIAELFTNKPEVLEACLEKLKEAYSFSSEKIQKQPVILKVIGN